MNLLVETFLRERNLAHLLPEWRHEQVQQHVLRHVSCLCVVPRQQSVTDAVLTITWGKEMLRVLPSTELVYLGRQCANLKHTHALTVDHMFAFDPLVEDLHCLVKKKAAGQYVLSSFAPTNTWLQVPPHTGLVLLAGTAFRVGSHILQVLQAPLIRRRHATLPCTSSVVPLPYAKDEEGESEIALTDAAPCIIECIAPRASSIYGQQWQIPYSRGTALFTVGTSTNSNAVLPASDTLAGEHQCTIQASMGYFWLLPHHPTYYQLYPSSRSVDITTKQPLHILLGGATQLILAVS